MQAITASAASASHWAGFRRVRNGISHPGDKKQVHKHVLSDFSREETVWVERTVEAISQRCRC